MQTFDDDDFSPTITADQLRAEREALGLSVEELSRILTADPADVAAWEAGALPLPLAGALCLALDCLRIRDYQMKDEVWTTLDERIDEMTALRDKIRRDRAETRSQLEIPPAT